MLTFSSIELIIFTPNNNYAMVSQVAGQLIATKTFRLYSNYLLSKIETTNAINVNFRSFNKLVEMTNQNEKSFQNC